MRWMMAVAMAVSFGAGAQEIDGFRWNCDPTGRNSMSCMVKNTGRAPAALCMKVVKVCKDGEKVADLCTGLMQPGELSTRVLAKFEPKVKIFEKCMGIEYREKEVVK